jgi:antitoxin component YwqK of YwqJK toxin-antitoxin module
MKNAFLLWAALCLANLVSAQSAIGNRNTAIMPDLVKDLDTTVFKEVLPAKTGFTRMYAVLDPAISFISPGSKTRIDLPGSVLVCVEGNLTNSLRNGLFTTYVIDKHNHSRRYRIAEQDFKNGLIDGHYKAFDLDGTLKYDLLYVKGNSLGKSVYYMADGKTPKQTNNYLNDSVFVATIYFDGGVKKQEQTMLRNVPNGPSKVYYPNGQLMSTATFLNGQFNDTLKYYYDNGALWTEEIFKNGLDWTILNNFGKNGTPQPAGTLTHGYGTRILYTETGQPTDTITYENGLTK